MEELPDWQELRAAGAAIKDDALLRLGELLPELEERVTEAGGTVHWARDADEANRIVGDIAEAHGVRELVKVKSIATEETRLNEALAKRGIKAWETDLAELIVQLANDSPSHILVPAIHKNRAEIRELFMRELDGTEDLTDDPAELAEAARRHLRRRFLDAKMGVSGANFAVAETGTIAVFESEGNGRMCTTLPETLVTVMGIEKVIPRWRDLEVFLQLLPRSSTAERMNPYTSLWTGVHEGDGPSEFHLVLLDNGRTRRARGRHRPPGAPLHPLLGVPERLPCVRAGRRARVRVRLSRADRGDPHASARGHREALLAALCIEPLRRLLRGLPGEDRHPDGAGRAAPAGRGDERARRRASGDARRGEGLLDPPGLRARPAALARGPPRALAARVERDPRPAARAEADVPRLVALAMSTAREEILARIDEALSGAPAPAPVPRDYRRTASHDDLAALFAERVSDYRANVRRTTDPGATVAEALAEHGATRVLDDAHLSMSAHELDAIDAVVTGCEVAIAETGTIVLTGRQGRRANTLVPDLHVCVVEASRIVASVPEAMAQVDPTLGPVTLIAGPSATSDIELSRVEGVHGPRRLEVIVAVGSTRP